MQSPNEPDGSTWCDSPLGQLVLEEESHLLDSALRRMHGDSLLWAGISAEAADLSSRALVRHRTFAIDHHRAGSAWRAERTAPGADRRPCGDDISVLRCSLEELPLANGSMDAVVLQHALELTTEPRTALREVARVLQPGGQVLLFGFNLFGSWSLARALSATPDRYLNPWRALDWLEVLGFEALSPTTYSLYRPPVLLSYFNGPRWQRWQQLGLRETIPVGNVFMVHMRKKSLARRSNWSLSGLRARRLAGAGYPKLALQQELIARRRVRDRLVTH